MRVTQRNRNCSPRSRFFAGAAFIVCSVLGVVGCDRSAGDSSNGNSGRIDRPDATRDRSNWQQHDDESRDATVHVNDEGVQRELDDAIAHARATADEAREMWLSLVPTEQAKWLIKWGVTDPLEQNASTVPIEFVWVQPVHWSKFRVEGVLVTEPVQDVGMQAGDLVAFPIEELADWVYKLDDRMDGPRQGGFTVDVLEKHFGLPEDE